MFLNIHVQQDILIFRADEYTWLGAGDDMRGIQKEIRMEGRIFLIPQSRTSPHPEILLRPGPTGGQQGWHLICLKPGDKTQSQSHCVWSV